MALMHVGLPTWSVLSGWLRALDRVLGWEERQVSLSAQALGMGLNPSSYYRSVKRVTGCSWGVLKARGSEWMLIELHRVLLGMADSTSESDLPVSKGLEA